MEFCSDGSRFYEHARLLESSWDHARSETYLTAAPQRFFFWNSAWFWLHQHVSRVAAPGLALSPSDADHIHVTLI